MVGGKVAEKWARGQQGPDHEGLRGSGLNPPNLKSTRSNSLLPLREVLCDFEQDFSIWNMWELPVPHHLSG